MRVYSLRLGFANTLKYPLKGHGRTLSRLYSKLTFARLEWLEWQSDYGPIPPLSFAQIHLDENGFKELRLRVKVSFHRSFQIMYRGEDYLRALRLRKPSLIGWIKVPTLAQTLGASPEFRAKSGCGHQDSGAYFANLQIRSSGWCSHRRRCRLLSQTPSHLCTRFACCSTACRR